MIVRFLTFIGSVYLAGIGTMAVIVFVNVGVSNW